MVRIYCCQSGAEGQCGHLYGAEDNPVFPTGQVGQAAAKPSLAYGNSLALGLAPAYRFCKA